MQNIVKFFRESAKENAEEIIDQTRKTQLYVSGAIAVLYALFGIHLFIMDGIARDNFFAFLIGGIAGSHWLLLRLNLIPRRRTLLAGNCFLVLFLLCLSVVRTLGGGYELLIVYTIVATVVFSLHPFSYSLCVLFCSIFDRVLQGIVYQFDFVEFGVIFLEEGFLLMIVVALNFYISYLQHRVFREMHLLKMDSNTDAMTGLYNRRYLEQYFRLHHQADEAAAMIHMDLDNFKTLNDTLGHQAGDALLIRMAQLLQEHFRKADCIARMGGDEFVIFMPHLEDTALVRKRVQAFLARLPLVMGEGEKQVAVSASIGVAFSGKAHPLGYQELYDLADTAMYQAKKSGKGKAIFWEK